MENSKKPRHKAICSECNGNGYKQFQIQENGKLNENKTILVIDKPLLTSYIDIINK